jgi:hypothetical protein
MLNALPQRLWEVCSSPLTRRRAIIAATVSVALTTTVVGLAAAPAFGGKLLFSDARMIIEFNDTDQDVGVQLFLDGQPWRTLRMYDPSGKKILEIKGTKSLKLQGLTELFFESSEPSLAEVPIEEFFARFPEGIYELEGTTVSGQEIEAEALFTHAIPDGPVILTPEEGSVQSAKETVIEWLPVDDPDGSEIQSYQVTVTDLIAVLPKRVFSVFLPSTATSVTVPPEFMRAGGEYQFEVLAIEAGGNQTLTSSEFTTEP